MQPEEQNTQFYDFTVDLFATVLGEPVLHGALFRSRDEDVHYVEAANRLTAGIGESLGLGPSSTLLEVGCGAGQPSLFLVKAFGCTATGVDLVEGRIHMANEFSAEAGLDDRARYVVGDATTMELEESSFDAVLFLESMLNMPEKDTILRRSHRYLRPGGRIMVSDYVKLTPESCGEEWRREVEAIGLSVHMATLDEMADLVTAAGFTLERCDDMTAQYQWSNPAMLKWAQRCSDTIDAKFGAGCSPLPTSRPRNTW
ncbi:Cyclopropane fatty-acyl-phospholipid synthase [Amycolatopsis arida]|uniref:Cyclopropane fatty-acyl-phospholipid synthase n=1 Tax=Amycolatopsis arida TaxID=587909 RepID=A0A1I6AWA5_9PSEU|nr:methyltransferase domain-containing protein [Amycolatopsis arida]TDX85396.1 cyclopropane fatty-acyl-phospholipid synthase-like methyltransferase [Amycolatopsis arida]SFQ72909.1 Cyclopropane fatty-acyl-phospholipid synthase [Amycolatopsis arida]